MYSQDIKLINGIQSGDIKSFKALFILHSEDMDQLAYSLIQDADKAISIVNEVLYRIYAEEKLIGVAPPLKEYLLDAVRKAINNHP